MATLGQKLRAAREKAGLTPSEVAAATHIKVQHIEAIEQNDFSKIAAAAYAKGFIKLYADFLELDPVPLVKEYVENSAPPPEVDLSGKGAPPRPKRSRKKAEPTPEASAAEATRPPRPSVNWTGWLARVPWARLAAVTAVLVAAITAVWLLIALVTRGVQAIASHNTAPPPPDKSYLDEWALVRPPPEPYFEEAP